MAAEMLQRCLWSCIIITQRWTQPKETLPSTEPGQPGRHTALLLGEGSAEHGGSD